MGSNETASTIPGGPRVIDVFDGNGAPSGPNCLLFSDADRPSNLLWDSSVVGRPRRPHAPALGALLRALDPKLWYWSVCCWGPVLICIHRWKRPRMRCRRLRTSSTDPRRPRGDLRTTNRQNSAGAPGLELPESAARPRSTHAIDATVAAMAYRWSRSSLDDGA